MPKMSKRRNSPNMDTVFKRCPPNETAILPPEQAYSNVVSNYDASFTPPPLNESSPNKQTSKSSLIAKEELNLLAKLVGCSENNEGSGDNKESCATFKLNIFDTSGMEVEQNTSR